MKRISNALVVVALAVSVLLIAGSCAEKAGTGERVSIPRVLLDCANTTYCNSVITPKYVIVSFTTSGCQLPQYGEEVAATMVEPFTCTPGTGCRGYVTGWVDKSGAPTSTIPSGTYSICARIDYNGTWPAVDSDTISAKDSVAIGKVTADQNLTTWQDL